MQLQEILQVLGLEEYYPRLADHGFATWYAVMSITEADMAVLGFKLGHRRKLQREIATYCGHAVQDPLDQSAPQLALKVRLGRAEDRRRRTGHKSHAGLVHPNSYRPSRRQMPCALYISFLLENPEISGLSLEDTRKLVLEQWVWLSDEEKARWLSRLA
ncbi:MAG: hypothetical protein M1818_000728 [Claussenomyces sp. TS43310]|nr:MAG: hypothetical protein M1818_000728 [Claussenomyces sp. TS43310]